VGMGSSLLYTMGMGPPCCITGLEVSLLHNGVRGLPAALTWVEGLPAVLTWVEVLPPPVSLLALLLITRFTGRPPPHPGALSGIKGAECAETS